MIALSYRHVTLMDDAHTYCIEASDIGIRPSDFTNVIPVARDFGNGRPLVRQREIMQDSTLIATVYKQSLGCVHVHVIND